MILAPQRILPVVVIDRADDALPLGRALVAGGITTVEVTLRTPAGLDAIEAMAGVEGLTVGAGTVRNTDDVARAVGAGAQFLVSPGFDRDLVGAAADHGVPILPGIATASEAQAAFAVGLRAVKVFPAAVLGGPAFLRALSGPFPELQFWPSGGITQDTVEAYLAVPAVEAVCGSWMVERAMIVRQDWTLVEQLSRASIPKDLR
ncbi:bifunctional 4-hydroxy-2-oxoglutarate aldolase/2-dehydro-3-deoxy-phosphogluconate aldolase [Curtobacterium albidum]|uniref:2-dehydro-3-deoxy-phosphogluconate aldolase n=1 Tax=Curtobacterium citreum TaxID=2036 RepID=A0A850DUP4_9MICO|nr:bifunctional 4-hydroxy-2-oxoglutarate aldolase/2-dehydro-3-deoxy-phosphogluconate aldolase [Curtobacterium albidum]NUU27870.1 bifunctional 4-hydroxy-2-oxoglutarate aldolase/2-dehydro-3-deoxy-phosphogluconate aldolase [Curtobacterium albidum]